MTMRRLRRDIAAGTKIKGDITTLEVKSIVEKLQKRYHARPTTQATPKSHVTERGLFI